MTPQSPRSGALIEPTKVVALLVLLGAAGLIVALFLWMVKPAAAREVQAACNGLRPATASKAFPKLPVKAPDFTLQDVDGKTVKLSELQGKVVVVNFWASWCDVCKAEKKSLARLTRSMGEEGLVVLSLASDNDPAEIDKALKTALGRKDAPIEAQWGGAPFRVLVDPVEEGNLGTVAAAWGIEKVPESFVVDRNGVIRMYLVNKRDWSADVVETCLRSFLDE